MKVTIFLLKKKIQHENWESIRHSFGIYRVKRNSIVWGKKKKEEEARSKGYNGLNFQMGLGWIMIHEFCSLPKLFVCSESRDTLKAILWQLNYWSSDERRKCLDGSKNGTPHVPMWYKIQNNETRTFRCKNPNPHFQTQFYILSYLNIFRISKWKYLVMRSVYYNLKNFHIN